MNQDLITISLAFGALIHIGLGVVYYLWRYGPRGALGVWLAFSWAFGLVRVLEARRPDFAIFTDTLAIVIWANIIVAAVCCLTSMIINAYDRNFVRRME